jgi:hypothetical protein
MTSPRYIETPQDFERTIRLGETTEGLLLEFKTDLGAWRKPAEQPERRKAQLECCRDISQFSNAWGGCLLYGVVEETVGAAKVARHLHPLDDFDARRGWVEQAIRNFLCPSTIPIAIHHIVVESASIMAINVGPSERIVMLWDPDQGTMECLRRTSHGRRSLNPEESEALAMNTRRASQLMLARVREETRSSTGVWDVELSSGVWLFDNRRPTEPPTWRRRPAPVRLGELGEHDFELRITARATPTVLRVPYGLLREAWATSDSKVGMFLHVRVVVHGNDELVMEPF